MYSGTHVSLDGCLYKVRVIRLEHEDTRAHQPPATLMGYGRLVHPRGSYVDAPYVSLYRSSDGYFAVI